MLSVYSCFHLYSLCWCFFFFSSRRRHTRYWRDWSSDVCSSDLRCVWSAFRSRSVRPRPCPVARCAAHLPRRASSPRPGRSRHRGTGTGLRTTPAGPLGGAIRLDGGRMVFDKGVVVAEVDSTEKITINVGLVDLGQIDLLVDEGFYANRTDFIRTAIRRQLETRADAVNDTVERRALTLGTHHLSRRDLEALRDRKSTRLNSSHANISYAVF